VKGTSYLRKVWRGVATTAKGMVLTWKHFVTRPTTIQYPEEKPYFSPFERGLHEFEPEVCIICHLCAVACPVNCIKIESEGSGKNAVLTKYEIDYAKCLFCALCVDPCPVDCIHMGQEYDLAGFERGDVVKIDFMKGEGAWRTVRTSAHPEAGLRAHGGEPIAATVAPHEPPVGAEKDPTS
jgi:NADH-quinone oxidoreductase subunit I